MAKRRQGFRPPPTLSQTQADKAREELAKQDARRRLEVVERELRLLKWRVVKGT